MFQYECPEMVDVRLSDGLHGFAYVTDTRRIQKITEYACSKIITDGRLSSDGKFIVWCSSRPSLELFLSYAAHQPNM